MTEHQPPIGPLTELDTRYSSSDATATPWFEAVQHLDTAEIFWLSTVRPDGRPHVTPLLAAWVDDALYFCTGADERKAKNLAANPNVVLTTGVNALREGFDLVIEGRAERETDEKALQRAADRYEEKYTSEWHFDVRDGAFWAEDNRAVVYRVEPTTAFGFGKEPYSQTRWRFA